MGALIGAFACSSPAPPLSPEPPPGTPRLVILLVVDQCRADYLDRFRPYLTGGLGRLLDESIVFTDAHHRHAYTLTAPGHATLATGTHPSRHGIIANGWFDRASGEEIAAVYDETYDKSPHRLLTSSLGDWLRQAYPAARVFTVGGKDRGAIFLGGAQAEAAFWYDRDSGHFISSDYYPAHEPPWLEETAGTLAPERWFGAPWQPLPETLAAAAELGLEPPDRGLFPNTFPHALGPPLPAPRESFYRSLYDSPFVDALTLRFASILIEKEGLGSDATPDYLGINLAAVDTVGHGYGPDSLEVLDTLLRLDQALGRFLDEVDTAVGLDATVVSLSADHGVTPVPELLQTRGEKALRFGAAETACVQRAWHALREAFGPEEWFTTSFFLDRELMKEKGVDPVRLETVASDALGSCPGIARAWTRGELEAQLPAGTEEEPCAAAYRNAFHPERSPDLLVQVAPHTLTRRGSGTSHGTPYPYDTHVPWLLRLPGGGSARRVETPVSTVDVAPTVAALVGIPAPGDLDGVDRAPLLP